MKMTKILSKVKEKVKKIIPEKLGLKNRKKIPKAKSSAPVLGREMPGFQQTFVADSKFSHPEPARPARFVMEELPFQYDQDRLVLQVRDPHWVHAYWEIRNQTLDRLKYSLGSDFKNAKRVLRVYDVTNIIFDGSNANSFFDIQVNDFANNWYIDTGRPGCSFCVDLGLMLPDGRFITILRSNVVQTPLEGRPGSRMKNG